MITKGMEKSRKNGLVRRLKCLGVAGFAFLLATSMPTSAQQTPILTDIVVPVLDEALRLYDIYR